MRCQIAPKSVHPSASPSRLHSRTGCHCGPFRWLWSSQTAFCISRQKWLNIKQWMDEMMIIMILSYNVSLYGLVFFLSLRKWFLASWRNILRTSVWGLCPQTHTGALALDPAGGFPFPRPRARVLIPNQNPGSAPAPVSLNWPQAWSHIQLDYYNSSILQN